MSKATQIIVDNLIEAFRTRPDDFVFSDHMLRDTVTKTVYWTSNGASYARIYHPGELYLGWWQGRRFHRALAYLQAYKTAHKTETVIPPLKVVS